MAKAICGIPLSRIRRVEIYINESRNTLANDPDHAPTLWEDVLYRDGYRIIPETITVGLQFANGEPGGEEVRLFGCGRK